uniref:Uncharacterized protein n=1 Tax=Siphoviridae sp. ct96x5 TaxID=2825367 RepID=A0A8S5PQL5_9CAUD|nr:MAG TPA: hypothetical protein [Siphoviridae sp. ct96x5]
MRSRKTSGITESEILIRRRDACLKADPEQHQPQ